MPGFSIIKDVGDRRRASFGSAMWCAYIWLLNHWVFSACTSPNLGICTIAQPQRHGNFKVPTPRRKLILIECGISHAYFPCWGERPGCYQSVRIFYSPPPLKHLPSVISRFFLCQIWASGRFNGRYSQSLVATVAERFLVVALYGEAATVPTF